MLLPLLAILGKVHPRIPVADAIAAFNNASPPGIFSLPCIEALYRYYHVPGPGGARAEQTTLNRAMAGECANLVGFGSFHPMPPKMWYIPASMYFRYMHE